MLFYYVILTKKIFFGLKYSSNLTIGLAFFMYSVSSKDYSNVNFGALIRVSDKALLKLPHKTSLLQEPSPLDFFYRESKTKQKLDIISDKIREYIREKQRKPENLNSKLRSFLLAKSYQIANRIRTLSTKFLVLANIKKFIQSGKLINKIEFNSPEYIDEWAKIGNTLDDKFININIEDGIIESLAKSDCSSIFILNHDNFQRDKFIYPIFNSFLNYGYATLGKQAECPRPVIVVSKNIFKLAGERFKKLYHKMGLVPVDASLKTRDTRSNFGPMMALINKFVENKVNIFIFPEGNNSIYKNKSLGDKFQQGTARIVKNSLHKTDKVRVVPIGVAYDSSPKSMGAINICKPLTFVRNGRSVCCTNGTENVIFQANLGDKDLVKRIVNVLCKSLQEGVVKSKTDLTK